MLAEFIDTYFLQPLRVESGYNIFNTIAYALLAVIVLYCLYLVLRRLKINIDFKFFLAVLPFSVLGASVRVFVDTKYISRTLWTISPGIWLASTALFFLIFLVSYLFERKTKFEYWKSCLIAGIFANVLAYAFVFSNIRLEHGWGALGILALFLIFIGGFWLLAKKFKLTWLSFQLSFLALAAHLWDATNTAVIVDFFGGWEKHPIPRFFIEKLGTGFAFIPLKLAVLLPAIYLVFGEFKDKKDLRNFLLIAIAVIGFSQGIRNFISLMLT